MLKLYRFASLVVLILVLGGCASRQSETQPSEPAPASGASDSTKVQQGEPPQNTAASGSNTPASGSNTSTSGSDTLKTAKKEGAPQPPKSSAKQPVSTQSASKPKPPSKPKPQTLPELSEQDQKLVSKVTKEVQQDSPVSTENPALVTVNRVLIAQQAMWLLSGSFSQDFKALEPNLPMETEEYRFKITQGDEAQTVIHAIAKTSKLHSFTGAAVAIPTQVPKSALCRTKLPSTTPPQAPTIQEGQVTCANDGVLVDT